MTKVCAPPPPRVMTPCAAAKRKARQDARNAEYRIRGNQPGQAAFLSDLRPGASAYIGGLGSGKTWAASRKLLYFHALNRCPSLAVAPTFGDLWRFVVPALVGACDDLCWRCAAYPNGRGALKFPHLLVEGQPILVLSADDPERFAGFEVGAIWIDEAARVRANLDNPLRDAPTQIRGRLRHPAAKRLVLIVSTTPEGTDTWVHQDFAARALPLHRAYVGSTLRNSALPPSYVDALRAALPADLAVQYLDGIAADYNAARAHPTFREETHVVPADQAAFTRGPVHIGADFNVSPLCWVAAQRRGDTLVVVDEVVINDYGLVDAAVRAAHDRGWGAWGPVHFHPDRSGNARNRVGDPEIATAQASARALGWDFRCDAFGANPSVQSRINLLGRMILDAAGTQRLIVSDRCQRLIDDLKRTGRRSSGYDPGPRGIRGHILDALGYLVFDLFAPGLKAQAANWHL